MFERWLGIAVSAGFLLVACGDDDAQQADSDASAPDAQAPSEAERWVGEVEDSDARVAVLAGAGRLRLFFCGGADSYETATHWFNRELEGDQLKFEEDGWKIDAQLKTTVTGTLERDGETHAFSAAPVKTGTLAGLYEGQGDCGRLGLIVLQPEKDDEPSAVGACVDQGRAPKQVNPITPIEAEAGKIRVQTPDGEDGATTLLQPAALQPL
jgi:hypothetical protein